MAILIQLRIDTTTRRIFARLKNPSALRDKKQVGMGIGWAEFTKPNAAADKMTARAYLVGHSVPYQGSGIRGQGTEKLPAASPPEKSIETPICFHLTPDS
ncbi:MAG: hypothetical protein LBL72_04330 [Candidatus Accumulibacter sp.]|nr:hypothetical protein [Accumulibacter sp.]